MSNGTASGEAQDIFPDCGISSHKGQCSAHFARVAGDVHAEPFSKASGHQPGADDEIGARNERAHHVVGAHHLRTTIRPERLKDVILGTIRQPIKQQIDPQQQQPPRRARLLAPRRLLALLARVQGKHGDARRHGRDDEVLVQRVALAEDGDVEEHDGEQLAALGEQKGDVVDVRQARVAKRAGQAARDGDEGQGREDAARGDDGRDGAAAGGRGEEVDEADGGGEDGLDRVEEDGEVPNFLRTSGTVRRRRQLLL